MSKAPSNNAAAAPPEIRSAPSHLGTAIVFVVLVAALALVLYRFDPLQHQFYPRCLFHVATGLDCPGCGGLRATHQLLHGNIRAAFQFNPLLTCVAPLVPIGSLLWWLNRRRNIPLLANLKTIPLVWCIAGIVIAFGVLRNLPWRVWLG
jgi:hypothetical protein